MTPSKNKFSTSNHQSIESIFKISPNNPQSPINSKKWSKKEIIKPTSETTEGQDLITIVPKLAAAHRLTYLADHPEKESWADHQEKESLADHQGHIGWLLNQEIGKKKMKEMWKMH